MELAWHLADGWRVRFNKKKNGAVMNPGPRSLNPQGRPTMGGILHLCVGCSPDRLAAITAPNLRRQVIARVAGLARLLPTVFVTGERADLCLGLLEASPHATVLRSPQRSALAAPGIDRYLGAATMVIVSGLETSREIYATTTEIASFRYWQVMLPEEAMADRHKAAHGSCLHILAHGFGSHVKVVPVTSLHASMATAGQDLAKPASCPILVAA